MKLKTKTFNGEITIRKIQDNNTQLSSRLRENQEIISGLESTVKDLKEAYHNEQEKNILEKVCSSIHLNFEI